MYLTLTICSRQFLLLKTPIGVKQPVFAVESYLDKGSLMLPDSICYILDPRLLGMDVKDRLKNALEEICIWLFRHQVWLETRKIGNPLWIGPQAEPFDRKLLAPRLKPTNLCRCGKQNAYYTCHMSQDVQDYYNCLPALTNYYVYNLATSWFDRVGIIEAKILNNLKRALYN
jgi:hypothetical protein